MATDSFRVKKSLNIEPIAGAAPTAEGDIAYDLTTHKASLHNGTTASPVVTEAHTATLTNKTINGSDNTVTNVSLTAGVTGTLPVANGGTNKTSWVANQVAYATSTTALAGDSNFTWDDVNARLYCGTGTTNGKFSVINTSSVMGGFFISSTAAYCSNFNSQNSYITQALQHYSATSTEGAVLGLHRSRGTIAAPGVVLSGDILASINANGLPSGGSLGTATTTGQASIKFYAMENLTTTAQATEIRFLTTPTGTITPKERLRIKQDGSIELAGATSGYVALIPPAAPTSYTLTLPSAQGAADSLLTNDGSGGLSWSANAASRDSSTEISNLALATSVGSSALTIAVKDKSGSDPSANSAVRVGMRSSTLTTGTYSQRTITSALSMVVSSGSTLGQSNATAATIYIYLIDNAGTLELAVSGALYHENQLISTTAEGGAGAADSASVVYSTTARSNVAFRLIGTLTNTQTTAGTWASAGTVLQVGDYGSLTSGAEVSALYTGAPPTGTLTNAYNTTTFGTKVKDSHNAYSSGSYTIPVNGIYSIHATSRQLATYAAGNIAIMAIFIDGAQNYTNIATAHSTQTADMPSVQAHGVPLLAGQVVTIRSYNDATTPTFSSVANQNYFSIVKTGNY